MKLEQLYDSNIFESNKIIGRKFYNKINGLKGKRILEVGCGTGDICKDLTKDNEVHGIDLSSKSLKAAKSRGVITKMYNIENGLPYKSAHFDILICSELVEHLFDPEHVIKEANRVLKKGGLLLLSTPNFYSTINRLKILKGRHRGIELPNYAAQQHIRFYSHASIREMLVRNNFAVANQEGIGFHPMKNERLLKFFEKRLKTFCDGIFVEAVKK
ncbi:MAG TPA: methyltransferase domain-containing protein [archaeon]|nr:methyltransferase domain-containing protein [archaeon]